MRGPESERSVRYGHESAYRAHVALLPSAISPAANLSPPTINKDFPSRVLALYTPRFIPRLISEIFRGDRKTKQVDYLSLGEEDDKDKIYEQTKKKTAKCESESQTKGSVEPYNI
ncbi:hypothetical protein EVAR_54011_1 [Eumeta japonica]|uniref:Uncharacterized protein n=1 Tax=Eumeta variegata TaxID=151549 RepID=A0A4C1XWB4_EUMVA|nr:hypothetical protein EVAR_54011_1 [Eumeta japonica]